jgi:hypothetical protein
MDALWWLVVQILWLIWSVLFWFAGYVLWLAFWVLLPVIIVAVASLRAAEYFLGPDKVRAWVKKRTMRFGAGTWRKAHRALFALGVMPIRVLAWLIVYGLWHSIISLVWTPKWSPWERAWSRRWRRHPA